METRPKPTINYEDFEPLCKWKREEERDLLEVYLQDFKKENIRVRINRSGILSIEGECLLNNDIHHRFKKEIKVSKQCKINEIRAKFSRKGILYVTFPKKMLSTFKILSSSENGSISTSLPSNCLLGGTETSSFKLNDLAVQVGAVALIAVAFGVFGYKYFSHLR
ncbi:hypothetical protein JCGZ_02696 [Jatropha curcas]|uniref:SHSP domain-containing protein n=1 Tax=Jatropha curcas TaxID=180498 RepID=A0A067KTY1_JATCU|nr:hypothetical protein JCGZ_02696 [Jatropha curcas]